MGLDTSHDAWHGSYGGFHLWRIRVAEAAGFPPLDEMDGFGPPLRPWRGAPGDQRLAPLLSHSDCDGDISPEDCASIAAALDDLGPRLDDWARPLAERFAAGCRRAAEAEERLEFH